MKAKEFDARFDRGDDVSNVLDMSKARRPGQQPRRVNVDFPEWMIVLLDKEAERIGTTRQAVIKFWVADRLDHPLNHG